MFAYPDGQPCLKIGAKGRRIRFDCFDPNEEKLFSFVVEQKRLLVFTRSDMNGEALLLEFAEQLRQHLVRVMPDVFIIGGIGIKDSSMPTQQGFYLRGRARTIGCCRC